MAEFRTLGYHPMDREYHESMSEAPEPVQLEEPIYPVSRLGETVPEQDPTGRFKNIIQTTQAAIRGGAGTVQLVMMTPHTSPIGGRPKAYGKEVRQTLREVAEASNVNIAGVEMPTSSLSNMTGFDQQQFRFSDERLREGLNEVKDAMHFIADVGGGGGVDLVSFEFPRSVNEARWQETDDLSKGKFEQEGEQPIGWLVDTRNGQISQFRKTELQKLPYDKKTFERLDVTEKALRGEEKVELNEFTWDDFKRWARKNHERNIKENRKGPDKLPETPDEIYVRVQLQGQVQSLEGMRAQHIESANNIQRNINKVNEQLESIQDQQTRKALEQERQSLQDRYNDFTRSAIGNQQQAEDLKQRINHLKPMEEYGVERSAYGYAEAGIQAMKVTQEGIAKGTVKPDKPVYIGPEIGWPGYFGSHPDEFINIVKGARERMVELLTNPNAKDAKGVPMQQNPFYDPSVNKQQAKQYADKHVKGLFDSSHMGMWLTHFKAKPGETEEQRIERFNKEFYLPAVKKIAKAGVVGGIQMVDAMSGAHAHLPPGQGVLPLRETAKIFKQNDYGGFIVSEGHEEEKFGEGRIRAKLWETAGAHVGTGYFAGRPVPTQWGQIAGNYFGRTYSPQFMFGGYSPSNEFKLWSDVPLE